MTKSTDVVAEQIAALDRGRILAFRASLSLPRPRQVSLAFGDRRRQEGEMLPDNAYEKGNDEAIAKPARRGGGYWRLALGLGAAVVIFACILGIAGLGLMKMKAAAKPTVVGSWARSLTTRHGTAAGTVTFSEDGSYTMTETFQVQLTRTYEVTVKQSGTWRFDNQTLYLRATESSHPKLSPVGETYTEEITELTQDEMISRDSENTVVYRRIGK